MLCSRARRVLRHLAACLVAILLTAYSPLRAQSALGFNSTLFSPALVSENAMTEGPDGNLWFTGSGEEAGGEMGRLTAAGVLTIVALPTANDPNAITSGPDGNLWFTVAFHGDSGTGVDSIGKITPDLAMTLYPLSAALITSSGIVAGPDGALWFTEAHTNAIGRITTSGEISGFPFPGRPTTAAA